MKKNDFLVIITFSIFFVACGHIKTKKEPTIPNEGWSILSENGYSIQYPEDWKLNKSGQGGTIFGILSKHSTSEDQFNENVNLIIQDLTNLNYDLDKFTQISEEQIKTMVSNSVLLESKRQNANDTEFQKVKYTGNFGQFNLTIEQYYWIRNRSAYVLTLTCETPQFDTYKETGEKILNSFNFN